MYTVFGHSGFVGREIVLFLKKKKKKIFLPSKKQEKFKKNLGCVIYCVGSDDWKTKKKKGFFSNFYHLKQIIFKNNFKSFIFLSTTRLYINSNSKTSENNFISARSEDENDYYNILKLMSETILLNLHKNIKILRISNIIGFNYNSPLLLPTLIRDSIKKSKITITINHNSTKDYILIDDLISLNIVF